MPWDFALILLVLGVFVPWRGAVRMREILARPRLDTADRLALYTSTIALQWLAAGVVAWRCHAHGLTPQHLGLAFPEPALTATTTLALSLLLGANQFYSLRRLARVPPDRHGFLHQLARKVMPQNLLETLAFAALVATVSLCEEFLYRGFVFAVFQDALRDSLLLAALGSSAFFALAHFYQGRRGLVSTFAVGVVFALARIFTGSLAPGVVAHFVGDLIAGLRAPRVLGERPGRREAAPVSTAPTPDPREER